MYVLAYPLLGTGRCASIGGRAVEQAVTGARVDHDRPILAPLLLDGLERGDALNRRHVSISPAEEPECGHTSFSRYGFGSNPDAVERVQPSSRSSASDGRGLVLSLPPANSSYFATMLC